MCGGCHKFNQKLLVVSALGISGVINLAIFSARHTKTKKDYWGFQHIREIADFYEAVLLDREPKVSGKEALKIQKIICEIYKEKNFSRNN